MTLLCDTQVHRERVGLVSDFQRSGRRDVVGGSKKEALRVTLTLIQQTTHTLAKTDNTAIHFFRTGRVDRDWIEFGGQGPTAWVFVRL